MIYDTAFEVEAYTLVMHVSSLRFDIYVQLTHGVDYIDPGMNPLAVGGCTHSARSCIGIDARASHSGATKS
jgi:hypothetical protein